MRKANNVYRQELQKFKQEQKREAQNKLFSHGHSEEETQEIFPHKHLRRVTFDEESN